MEVLEVGMQLQFLSLLVLGEHLGCIGLVSNDELHLDAALTDPHHFNVVGINAVLLGLELFELVNEGKGVFGIGTNLFVVPFSGFRQMLFELGDVVKKATG